jgi:predicted ribonuclease YlaK
VNGPAGTGKTMLATEHGIRFFLTDTYEKLIFTRPSVSVDEDLGFLPGTLEEKMAHKYYCEICDTIFISKLYMDKHIEDKNIIIY